MINSRCKLIKLSLDELDLKIMYVNECSKIWYVNKD